VIGMASAFILGVCEFRQSITAHYKSDLLLSAYDHGRELAHKITFRRFEP